MGRRKYKAVWCDQTACLITEVMNVGTWNPKYETLITTLPPKMSSPCSQDFIKKSPHLILRVEQQSRNFMEKKEHGWYNIKMKYSMRIIKVWFQSNLNISSSVIKLVQREDSKTIPLLEIDFCQCQKEVIFEKHLDSHFLRSE